MNVESDHPKLVRRILGTFKEMPGVQLSLQEAERMFGLRESTCRALLEQLVGEKSLRRTTDGRYAIA
jgi:DNA-binding IclR family transcriptional regulator